MAERLLYRARRAPAPRPDAAADTPRYRAWLGARPSAHPVDLCSPAGDGGPAVSVVLVLPPAGEIRPAWARRCLRSLRHQAGPRWELVVPGPAGSPLDDRFLTASLGRTGARRVVRSVGPERAGPAESLRLALGRAGAPFVLLLGVHDELVPGALGWLLGAARGADVVYADEDRLDDEDLPTAPVLKPDWSPELLLDTNYLGRPVLVRRQLATAADDAADADNAQGVPDWEHHFLLTVSELAGAVAHVAEVLCHRRPPSAAAELASTGRPTAAALARRGEDATVEPGPLPGSRRVRRRAPRRRVGIVVPFRDSARLLRTCVDSVDATAGNLERRWLLVDNGSVEPETLTLLERLSARPDVVIHHDPRPFNWAALNNAAVASADDDVMLFLNNDIEAHRPGWLEALVAQVSRPGVAVAGARLLYPDGPVQHAGIVIGLGGAAGHVLAGLPADQSGYLGMAVLQRDCSAVTGACMAVDRGWFEELEGFDESLGLDLNDVDFCLRARGAGQRVIYEPLAELVHHESPSRGTSGSVPDISRFIARWDAVIAAGDPFLNRHLTRADGSCALLDPDEETRWAEWRAGLEAP